MVRTPLKSKLYPLIERSLAFLHAFLRAFFSLFAARRAPLIFLSGLLAFLRAFFYLLFSF
jgi:hypothetical protein